MVPYTLTMGLLWFGVAFVIGLATGVVLRSVVARRQLAAARDGAETRRLRRRIAELEREAAGSVADGAHDRRDEGPGVAGVASLRPPGAVDAADVSRDVEVVEVLEAVGVVDDVGVVGDVGDVRAVDAAGDDLTRLEGLGPAVRELCEGVGITTFAALATTEVAALRTMLDDAGARYRVHDPTTWPAQAKLLAEGRAEEFEALVASIRASGTNVGGPDVGGSGTAP